MPREQPELAGNADTHLERLPYPTPSGSYDRFRRTVPRIFCNAAETRAQPGSQELNASCVPAVGQREQGLLQIGWWQVQERAQDSGVKKAASAMTEPVNQLLPG